MRKSQSANAMGAKMGKITGERGASDGVPEMLDLRLGTINFEVSQLLTYQWDLWNYRQDFGFLHFFITDGDC